MYSYKYQTTIEFIALLSVMVGVLVITGWLAGNFNIITLFRGYSAMKFNTALCLVLSGSALLFFFRKGKFSRALHKVFSLTLFFIGGVSVLENIFDLNLISFEKIFANDMIAHFYGNQQQHSNMLLAASISFTVIGLSCFTFGTKHRRIQVSSQWCLFFITLISAVAIMGHVYKISSFYKMTFFSPMALHTAIAIFLLSIAASLVYPSLGITAVFTGDGIGNIMARRLFPMIAFLLLGVTYLRLQVYRNGLFDMDFATILFTTCVVLIVFLLIWITALQLNKIDKKRKVAEDSIIDLNNNIEQKIEHRTLTLKDALQQLEKSRHELNEALNKEKELNELKSKFVSLASHEFKTPLSTILSSASLISSYDNPDGKFQREKHVSRITNSVMHLNELLEDFLSLGKLEAGRISFESAQLNIKEFLEEIMEEMTMQLKPGQIIRLEQTGSNRFITDKRLFKNILLNILSNAIKFSPEKTEVIVKVENTDDGLLVSISDRGIGISEEDQQYLFDSFYRGKNAANIEGTGLGLHIVKRYIDILKGNINLKSQLEKGTTINIKLPVSKNEMA